MQFPIAIEAGASVVEGPYVAETFAVTVEDEYIVLDVP
jgi:3-phenylpropionate/trans-cinnamate dioxygenase ferredoxin subunit